MKRKIFLSLAVFAIIGIAQAYDIVEGFGKMAILDCPAVGEMHFPTIMVSYADVPFLEGEEKVVAHFNEKFNLPGYNANGGPGSVRDYFTDASAGRFVPVFDILGCVALKHDRAFYGGDSNRRRDVGAADMVIEAVEHFADTIDWSLYDSNGDGKIDDVVIVFAGESTYSGDIDEAILPTSYVLHYDQPVEATLASYGWDIPGSGYYIDNYTLINELNGGKYDGIGTFVHEYMHALGLADLYNPWDEGGGYTPQRYDVMDTGIYNHNSLFPPTPSAFERFALGWLDLDFLEEEGDYELQPLEDSPVAYAMYVGDNELYIVENRQQKGWDRYIPGHGMLLWHIEYDAGAWYNNMANYEPDHQRVDLIEASGTWYKNSVMHKRYPFPGASNVTKTPEVNVMLGGREATARLTSISEAENGNVSFTLKADYSNSLCPSSISEAPANGVFVSPDGSLYIKVGDKHFDLLGRQIVL